MTVTLDNFLNPANPNIRLEDFNFSESIPQPEVPFLDYREAYQQPVPLSRNERFTDSLALNRGETSLSRTPQDDKTYISEINLYVLNRHLPILRLISAEISNNSYQSHPHGEANLYHKGCSGPLCRRARRLKTQESILLNKYKRTRKFNPTTQISPILTNPAARYRSLRVRSRTYAAVEPLLFLYSARELTRISKPSVTKTEEHLINLIKTDLIYPYMLSIFAPDIQ